MKVIKQSKNHTCLHCVIAMIIDETEEYVIDWFKNYGEDATLNIQDAVIILAHHGVFVCTEILNVSKEIVGSEYVSIVKFDNTPMMIAVDSEDFPEYGHAIYWDGEKVYDPNPNTERTKLEEYDINTMYPLSFSERRLCTPWQSEELLHKNYTEFKSELSEETWKCLKD